MYSQVHNKWEGGQINGGEGFKDLEKLLNSGVKINGGWEQNIKELEETKIGLSLNTLLFLLNIGISSILWSRLQ